MGSYRRTADSKITSLTTVSTFNALVIPRGAGTHRFRRAIVKASLSIPFFSSQLRWLYTLIAKPTATFFHPKVRGHTASNKCSKQRKLSAIPSFLARDPHYLLLSKPLWASSKGFLFGQPTHATPLQLNRSPQPQPCLVALPCFLLLPSRSTTTLPT